VVGEHVLVRGDDGLARRERRRDQRVRRLVAAHQLDDHVGVVRGHEVGRCVGQQLPGQAALPRAVEVAHRDRGELEGAAVGRSEPVAEALEPADNLAADRPCAEHGDAQWSTAHRATPA